MMESAENLMSIITIIDESKADERGWLCVKAIF